MVKIIFFSPDAEGTAIRHLCLAGYVALQAKTVEELTRLVAAEQPAALVGSEQQLHACAQVIEGTGVKTIPLKSNIRLSSLVFEVMRHCPIYRKAIVTYLDILGFRKLIENENPERVRRILHATRDRIDVGSFGFEDADDDGDEDGPLYRKDDAFTLNFSDLTLRLTLLSAKEALQDRISMELRNLCEMQLDLARKDGIFMRGAVSHGDLFMDGDYVFGPGLVRSYELAEKVAVFPRIILDPDLIKEVNRATGKEPDPRWHYFCQRADDGVYYLDYLFKSISVRVPIWTESVLQGHKQAIEESFARVSSTDQRARQKLVWTALYHNSTLRRFKDEAAQLPFDELEISEQTISGT
jgi:hypothetical protein